MDKYEYKLMAEEIVRLAGERQYKAAAKMADEIRWEKVKNVQMLCTVSEIYERVGKYEESKEVLLLAYHRSPNKKTIVYRLTDLSIALKDYQEATDFYHEYVQLAPNDNNVLLLKYKIYKGKGAKLETLIGLLEEFKTKDYQEEWILELARLYHQAGNKDKCVDICNEIDLWFNEGTSVIQALKIKKIYEPLTPMQEKKLQNYEEEVKKSSGDKDNEKRKQKTKKKKVDDKKVSKDQVEKTAGSSANTSEVESKEKTEERVTPTLHPAAEAILKMTKQKPRAEVKRGFSILPKENVDKEPEETKIALPDSVEKAEMSDQNEDAKKTPIDIEKKENELQEDTKEKVLEEKEALSEGITPIIDMQKELPEENQKSVEKKTNSSFNDDYEEEKVEEGEKPQGILGKMFSRLKLEDDELDDDFDDDYHDDMSKEEGMVARGLTGQYEKVVIDEDDDETDPLNTRMTAPIPVQDEEEYEYVYGDEDEAEEYEEIEEKEEEISAHVITHSNKRFRFFHNMMEDDEMFEEEEEYEPEPEPDEIPFPYAAQYDTLNLQKELAKSIQQLMDATEKETVDTTLENVKKLVEESHIPKLSETMRFKAVRGNMLNNVAKRQAERLERARDIEEVVQNNAQNAAEELQNIPTEDATVLKADSRPKPAAELAIKLKPTNEEENQPIDCLLTQEADGQLSIFMMEEEPVEEQMEGQLSIEDVLRAWERQELLSENDKEKRVLEDARRRALEETQGIMTEIMGLLKEVIPKIGSIKDGEEKMSVLAESLERVQKSLPFTQGLVEAAVEGKEAASAIEAACAEAVMELEKMEETEMGQTLQEEAMVEAPIIEAPMIEAPIIESPMIEAPMIESPIVEPSSIAPENALEQDTTAAAWEEDSWEEESWEEGVWEEDSWEEEEEEVSAELMPELEQVPEEEEERIEEPEPELDGPLSEEQKDILSYFMSIKSINPVLKKIVKHMESRPEHMIITGEEGNGKTSIAMRIIKAVQLNKEDKLESIAKIRATLLNEKKVTEILDKVDGGVLIIEKAGSLKPSTVYAIDEALYTNRYYVQIVLVDSKKEIAKLLHTTQSFINDIQMRVDLPAYTNNELAEFAKTYAEENGYKFDEMAILALHSVIEIFQTDQHAANLEDVKNIMNEAMEHADKRTSKLLGKIFGKKNVDGTILLESDFE